MQELTVKDYKKIDEIMQMFNFDQAVEILQMIHDKYGEDFSTDDFEKVERPFKYQVFRVPTVQELMLEAKRMLEQVIKEDLQFIGSGHLKASKWKFTDYPNDYSLELTLDVMSWIVEAEEETEQKENK